MALTAGTCFGPYEIAESIGAGGMGEVYRATDTKLKRDVAIKVLPASLASDAERLVRFQREAELLASLNHPNIAQIYGLEESGGTTALILEFVDGLTLADRIAEGALPVDEAIDIAMQITGALEAAHSQGIVHRDLKPSNIKLKLDGTVKVLDFGIAKALDLRATSGLSPIMETPTVTETGIILGTAAYMSPEQARGKGVDQRTDIWAFGCVLYEMLTAQQAFGGEDVTVMLARILERGPDLDALPAAVPSAVRQTIHVCLQKDVRKRVADIRDVHLALEGAFETVASHAVTAGIAPPVWRRPIVLGTAAVVVTGIGVGVGENILRSDPDVEPPAVSRFDYDLPAGQRFRTSSRGLITISPNGRQFAYDTVDGLYLRRMDELEAKLIPGVGSVTGAPMFSPDGESVAYWDSDGQFKRIATNGGAPVPIATLEPPFGVSWEADGTILVGQTDGIYRVSATGGAPEIIIPLEEGTVAFGPQLLPDGETVLFSVAPAGNWDAAQIVAQSLTDGARKVLVSGGSDARYLPTGHIVYGFSDGLFAVVFDPDTLTVSGQAVRLLQGTNRGASSTGGSANYDVSADGTLVYVIGGGVNAMSSERVLVWVDRTGRETPLGVPPRNYVAPRISPDGSKVALDVRDEELDIWMWDLDRITLTRLTFDPGEDEFPTWSPDGERIVFSSTRGARTPFRTSLFWKLADGTGSPERLAESTGQIFPTSFLPDASGILVFGAVAAGTENDDIALLGLDEDQGDAIPLINSIYQEAYPEISPDGRWLAYVSNESGRDEIYVRSFPEVDAGGRWQVTTAGGTQPLWARNGQELYYRNGQAVIAVPIIQADTSFGVGRPQLLFERDYVFDLGGRNYDVSVDGEQFLMIKEVDPISATSQIIVVQNWFEELNRLAPPAE